MSITFYHGHGSPYSWRVWLALEVKIEEAPESASPDSAQPDSTQLLCLVSSSAPSSRRIECSILLVDGDLDNQKVLTNHLERAGVFVAIAANGEAAILRALLEREEMPPDRVVCDVPARIEWWPLVLRGPLDGSRLAATGIRLYRGSTGDVLYAVNWNQGRAYYWSQ